MRKKLIEVALPLETINTQSAREKSIRHGHPSTLHLWWARRPLAAARAVIFTSIIDDPDQEGVPSELLALIDKLPLLENYGVDANATIGEVRRQKLFGFISELVKWENSNNPDIIGKAQEMIKAATGGNPPPLLDPFAGGGAIPLEAQRLGLEAHASDLNPVAVMINKAMIEIPSKFAGQPPVNPEARANPLDKSWIGAQGLAEDVRYYGEWMKKKAFERIGYLYPKVKDEQGIERTVIAWIWARTVKCPNPACGCEMPLVRSFELSKKKGKEAYVHYDFRDRQIKYSVKKGKNAPNGTVNRKGSTCVCCASPVSYDYMREESRQFRMRSRLIAIVAEGNKERLYLSPSDEHIFIANIEKPSDYPQGELAHYPGHLNTKIYGLDTFDKLFTNRQLTALTTLSNLIAEAQLEIEKDAGNKEYAQSVSVYLAFAVDREADVSSAVATWINTIGAIRNTFARQAIPMVWDYAEANLFSSSTGCFTNMLNWIIKCIELLPTGIYGDVKQADAQSDSGLRNIMVSTDPPYYDNIGYADLSDFFYVWLRKALKNIYPELFTTMLVPKAEELVAIQYHFDGDKDKAKCFFESGMLGVFKQICKYARNDIPVTIYYAFKQSESIDNEDNDSTNIVSTGWETMLSAIVQAGFSITGTWPMRTEREVRTIASGSNALASSIILVCRKRPVDAPTTTRRDFINTLKRELKPALQKLQTSNIAPVDLAQSAIGPGMSVYSRYSKVLEADGNPMSVRSALQIINQELDLYFTEQDGELDRDSRFCVDLYTQHAFNDMKFGEADVLARAKNTSVEKLARQGILYAQKGIVRLLTREEIPEQPNREIIWLLTQQLTHAMEKDGVVGVAKIIADMLTSEPEHAKALAYRLFTIAERKGLAQEAFAYNSIVIAWPEIQAKAAELQSQKDNVEQMTFLGETYLGEY